MLIKSALRTSKDRLHFNQIVRKINNLSKISWVLFLGVFLFFVSSEITHAATFTVSKTADTDDGTCDADCSLREAIAEANASITDDTIDFASPLFDTPQTITLTIGELLVSSGNGILTIDGLGADKLAVSGNNASRVLNIGGTVEINGVTITGGNADDGGGIYNDGTLTLNNSTVSGNNAPNSVSEGGGIYSQGALVLNGSTVSNNTSGSLGGGMSIGGGTAMLMNSTLNGNTAGQNGGIYNASTLTIVNSTVSNNSASIRFGGIGNQGTLTITNSTVSENSSNLFGGINNSGSSTVNVANSIVSGNISPTGPDVSGTFNSLGSNLVGKTDGSSGFTATGDQTGTVATPLDAKLGSLQDNSGSTFTHALLSGSPAINAGSNALIPSGITTDQRGTGFLRIFNTTVDIGAFERNMIIYTVTKTADTNDGTCDADCSLREAVAAANAAATDDIIDFVSPLFDTPQTITLTTGTLTITNNGKATISGPTAAGLTISGNNANRIFVVNSNAEAEINSVTISDGNSGPTGGAIFSNGGSITLNNSTVSNNTSTAGGGGGIYSNAGTLILNNSTVSGNSALFSGGGIFIDSGAGGPITVNNSTITDNSGSDGGGIINFRSINVGNTIIAGNNAPTGTDVSGSVSSLGYNLVGKTDGSTGFGATGDQTGTIASPLDAKLGPLQDNGGPTFTRELLSGSPAINSGSNALIPTGFTTDQRGMGFGRIFNTTVDIGAFERTGVVFTVTKTADTNDGTCDTDCSLREAIAASNAAATDDVIEFASPLFDISQTNILTMGGLLVSVNESLTIDGPGVDKLTVSGGNSSRVFTANSGANVVFNRLTIANGSSNSGSGILVNLNGTVTLNNSTVSGNSSSGSGAGIFNDGGFTTLNNSTVSGNNATGGGAGGVYSNEGNLILNNTTVSGNIAFNYGGGIGLDSRGRMTMNNSTVSGNTSTLGDGGGIMNFSVIYPITINNSTISNNTSGNIAGGIANYGTIGFNVANTIIAENTALTGPDVGGSVAFISQGYNLVGKTDGSTGFGATGDQTGTIASPLDAVIGPLQENGGPTETHALLPGSPAIDASNQANFPPMDQRGYLRPANGNLSSVKRLVLGALPDIGAFEALAPTAANAAILGRVLSPNGIGISSATVHITDQNGDVRTARVNSFGNFKFTDIEVGQTLVINVYSKNYQFTTLILTVNESITNLNLMAQTPDQKGEGSK